MTSNKALKLAERITKEKAPHLLKQGLEFRIWVNPDVPKSYIAVAENNFIAFVSEQVSKLDSQQMKEVVLHELAHVLNSPNWGHGKKWKKIYLSLGGNGKRYFYAD